MKLTVIFILLILFHSSVISQTSDFLLLKKNDHVITSYYSGSPISFGTTSNTYSGIIMAIRKDSLLFRQYDIRQIPSNLGVYILDTLAVYDLSFNYHDIVTIDAKQRGFNIAGSGAALFGGGITLTTAGLVTWLLTKPGTRYYASTALVVGSATLTAVGYLLLKSKSGHKLGHKYFLEYISTVKRTK